MTTRAGCLGVGWAAGLPGNQRKLAEGGHRWL